MGLLTLISVLICNFAFGVEEGAETFFINDDFPLATIISQIANFSILILIIYFTQRKTISAFFAEKRKAFMDQVEAASNTKKEAQEKLQEIQNRVQHLESTFEQQVEEAKRKAEDLYHSQLAEAKNESIRMRAQTQSSLDSEVQREIEKLRVEAFAKSAELAEKDIGSKMTLEQQKAWNSHFVQNVEGAH